MELFSSATLLCAAAVALGAFVQGTSGIGFALFAAPLVALFHPELVPGPMLVLGGSISLLTVLREYRHIDYRAAGMAFAGRMPGTLLAGAVVGLLAPSTFATIFAFLILAAIAVNRWGRIYRSTPLTLGAAGLVSGFMGTITSIGTPPVALAMQNMPPARLRATMGLFLICGSLLSLATLAWVGRFGWVDLQRGVLLLPALLLGFWLSGPLRQRGEPEVIRRIVLAVCVLSALVLLVQHW